MLQPSAVMKYVLYNCIKVKQVSSMEIKQTDFSSFKDDSKSCFALTSQNQLKTYFNKVKGPLPSRGKKCICGAGSPVSCGRTSHASDSVCHSHDTCHHKNTRKPACRLMDWPKLSLSCMVLCQAPRKCLIPVLFEANSLAALKHHTITTAPPPPRISLT